MSLPYRRTVITGLGAVTPVGIGAAPFWEALRAGRDPALDRVLHLISIDERAHYDFFRRLVQIYLEYDRPGTLEQLRRVVNTFRMPAVHLFVDGARRAAAVKALRIFDEDVFIYEVYEPVLAALGVRKPELRRRNSPRELVTTGIKQ